jgi:hypothetical protein
LVGGKVRQDRAKECCDAGHNVTKGFGNPLWRGPPQERSPLDLLVVKPGELLSESGWGLDDSGSATGERAGDGLGQYRSVEVKVL